MSLINTLCFDLLILKLPRQLQAIVMISYKLAALSINGCDLNRKTMLRVSMAFTTSPL